MRSQHYRKHFVGQEEDGDQFQMYKIVENRGEYKGVFELGEINDIKDLGAYAGEHNGMDVYELDGNPRDPNNSLERTEMTEKDAQEIVSHLNDIEDNSIRDFPAQTEATDEDLEETYRWNFGKTVRERAE